jgi:hypothetical protein
VGRRFSRVDLFAARSSPSWLVFVDPWWNVQAPPQRIEAGGDLLDAFLTEMLRSIATAGRSTSSAASLPRSSSLAAIVADGRW